MHGTAADAHAVWQTRVLFLSLRSFRIEDLHVIFLLLFSVLSRLPRESRVLFYLSVVVPEYCAPGSSPALNYALVSLHLQSLLKLKVSLVVMINNRNELAADDGERGKQLARGRRRLIESVSLPVVKIEV